MRVSENKLLVWEAMKKINGGTVHDGDELIATYRNALDTAMDGRCKGKARKEAVLVVQRAEQALHRFVYPGA